MEPRRAIGGDRPLLMTKQFDQLTSVAVEAVRTGMAVVADWAQAGRDLQTERVGDIPGDEFVTAVDGASEAAIRSLLHDATPSIPVVGEIRAESDVDAPWVWVVDPVDGTTNLVNGDPFVSVTVALLASGDPVVGATGCPFTDELWSARAGGGAEDAHGRPLEIARAVSCHTIALDPKTPSAAYASVWENAAQRLRSVFADVRPLGSIALEMARVASGDYDGFVSLGQPGGSSVLDYAAGTLLIREAGGDVLGLDGRRNAWTSEVVLAGNPKTLRLLRTSMDGFKV
jgi:myo-inositol-1(or 4)-monophosphatase